MERCVVRAGGYEFDLTPAARRARLLAARRVLLEAPQGLVQFLEPMARALERCVPGVEAIARLEPSYGLCSVSLSIVDKESILVHVGHEFYPYPFCGSGGCSFTPGDRVVVVPGVYLGGDADTLLRGVEQQVGGARRVVIATTAQHGWLAERLARGLGGGRKVMGPFPVVGCYYSHLLRLYADVYVVVAGGRFHGLGLGLASGGEARVLAADPYTGHVEDIGGEIVKILAKRMWRMQEFLEARSIGVIEGLLPGQRRPGIAEAIVRLARRRGLRVRRIYAERVTREYLDNLGPSSYDAFVVTSCPRLAIEDLGDYWRPVLAPGEARLVLSRGRVEGYSFPW